MVNSIFFLTKVTLYDAKAISWKSWLGRVTPRDPMCTKMSPNNSFFYILFCLSQNGLFLPTRIMKKTRFNTNIITWYIGCEGGTPQDIRCSKMSPKVSFFIRHKADLWGFFVGTFIKYGQYRSIKVNHSQLRSIKVN